MRALATAAGCLILYALVSGQTTPVLDDAKLPRFEVVSVKPGKPDAFESGMGFRPGAFFVKDGALFSAFMMAFGLRMEQVSSLPDFLMRERFTIEARAPEGAPRADLPLMVRALFIDRFKLRYHIERKEEDGYVLTLARRDGRLGPNLHASSLTCPTAAPGPQGCGVRNGPGLLKFGGMPFSLLVSMLSNQTGKQVVDRTGLAGNYDGELRFSLESVRPLRAGPDAPVSAPDDAPSIFDAVQDQLGLRLEKNKAPVDHLVIDHIERPDPD